MRFTTVLSRATLVAGLFLAAAAPALSGPNETALLQKYTGAWKGTGTLVGAEKGSVTCRLTMQEAKERGKFSYSGRCTFGGGGASFRGVMTYDDAGRRFVASSTSQGVQGSAIGKKQGGGVVFAMSQTDTTYGTASSTMSLVGGIISMQFKLVDKKGETTQSKIDFAKG